jgi:hypothetical protein
MKRLEDYYKEGMKLPWWWSGLKVMAVMQGRMLNDLAEKVEELEKKRKIDIKEGDTLAVLRDAFTHSEIEKMTKAMKCNVIVVEDFDSMKVVRIDREVVSQEIMKSTMEEPDVPALD